jgi:hypothetical protein
MGGGGGGVEGTGRGGERPRRHARRPAPGNAQRGGDGGPSGMARDRCPVGLRRRRGLSRRRRRVKAVWPGTGARRSAATRSAGHRVGAATEENQAVRRASGGAREERDGGAGGVEGRQILEEQSLLEVSDRGQMCLSSVGVQARRWATGGSPPPISGARRSYRWMAHRGAPMRDLESCRKHYCFAGSRRNGGWIGAMQGAR